VTTLQNVAVISSIQKVPVIGACVVADWAATGEAAATSVKPTKTIAAIDPSLKGLEFLLNRLRD
jgi:hypothetical protein